MPENQPRGGMSRRQIIREKRRRERQRKRLITTAAIAGAALVVAALLIYPSLRPIGEIVTITPRAHPMAEGAAMGDPNAPVTLEEFSDFQCPACRSWYQTVEPLIIENYVASGQVRFVYRNFPFIGPESFQAANASMCAAEQGRFWDYHDMLFANQTGENIGAFTTRRLTAFAETLGLDVDAFNECLRSNRYQEEINQDLARGRNAGVRGTPTIMLNGRIMQSSSYEFLQQQIEALLAAAGQ